jgi:hypothetical protein
VAGQARDSLGLLPLLAQGLLSLAHMWEESGDDLISPHLQVQGGIKMRPQPFFFFPFLTWQNGWIPFPQLSYSTSPHPHALFGFFHLEHKDLDLLRTMIADNKMAWLCTHSSWLFSFLSMAWENSSFLSHSMHCGSGSPFWFSEFVSSALARKYF